MSEILLKNVNALIVSSVEEGSPAHRTGFRPGDLIRQINGKPIIDILDYRFHSAASRLEIIFEREGVESTVRMRKGFDEDAGFEFEADLGDKIHTCKNKCVFCFIHQQPKKMRKSLYLMDDDFRLSFMHGNYVTLTNLSDQEWNRILEQRLSPLYVSVHATDPDVRQVLLGRKEPTPIIPQLRELADHGIDVHAQIVLCPGLNDEDVLNKSLYELSLEHRSVTGKRAGVQSVAIVPVGMTRYRERLPNLVHVERDYARDMIKRVLVKENEFAKRLGTRFAWLADEWYHIAQTAYPGRSHYEEFPQLEDGIGTVRLFLEDAKRVSRKLPTRVPVPLRATVVTAEMPASIVQGLVDLLNKIEGVDINVCVIKNNFFGGDIHIAGLMTGQDILEQLSQFEARHEVIYIPEICLKDGELFLDDITIGEARTQSKRDLRTVGNRPSDLAIALGLIVPEESSRHRGARWLMEAAG